MKTRILFLTLFLALPVLLRAEDDKPSRLTVGGYGEVALTRNFYSDNVYRYSNAAAHKDETHGRFDIPHAVIYVGYDFGKGWTMQTEIEFEHGGGGSAVEKEFEEAGEWESEVEKGGEVELEQFWIQKSFCPQFNVRMGHLVVPVGGLNYAHEPLNFFTVYRPEGEFNLLPSTWHDTGVSLWGQAGKWRYEALFIAGLDAMFFDRDHFVKYGASSPFEFKVANRPSFAARLDNRSVKGLRLGLSGFYGQTMNNTYPYEKLNSTYETVTGTLLIGAFDFACKGKHVIVRGNADYGRLSDALLISKYKRNKTAKNAPYSKESVGSEAFTAGGEAGYDLLSFFGKARPSGQKLYLFGRYEYYNSYIPAPGQDPNEYTAKHRMAVGFNWIPIPQIAVKCEYSHRFLKSQYNSEPSFSVGIAYQAFFKK